jgi:hypothetical protein
MTLLRTISHHLGLDQARHRVATDDAGRDLRLTEISIRAVLDRIDPLCTIAGDGHVQAPAEAVADAIADRANPVHRRRANRIAAAPLSDWLALRRLRRVARTQAIAEGATLDLVVPAPIDGWIRLRYERADRLMAELHVFA